MSRIRVRKLPHGATEDQVRRLFSPAGDITDVRIMRTDDGEARRFAYVGFKTVRAAQEALTRVNGSQLGGRQLACEIAPEIGPVPMQAEGKGPFVAARLFVGNLPYLTREEELKDAFSNYGQVVQVQIVLDRETGESRGFGFVQFALPESASRALELNYSTFQGRVIRVKRTRPVPA